MQPLVLLQKAEGVQLGEEMCSLLHSPSCVHWDKELRKQFMYNSKITQNTKKRSTLFSLWGSISTGRSHPEELRSLCLWRYSKPSMTWLWAVALDKMICRGVTSVTESRSSHWEKLQTVGNNCIPNFQILSLWHPASDLTLWLALRTTQFWIQKIVVISSSFSREATQALPVTAGKYTCGGWRNCSVI